MPALATGTNAPAISLHDINGEHFSLTEELKRGPVVLAFFKISCPVCQYAMPFLQRLYQGFKGKANIVGVSQNSKLDTSLFQREYGITFRTLLDDPERYPASNAFGLTNVPSNFLIAPDGSIELSSVGWSRDDIAEIARRLGEMLNRPPAQVFRPGEDVPAYKAG
jgi:peroxiredoxin